MVILNAQQIIKKYFLHSNQNTHIQKRNLIENLEYVHTTFEIQHHLYKQE